jgi:hypothetical protein
MMYLAKKKGKQRIECNVVPDGPRELEGEPIGIERRATARILCSHTTACVKPVGQEEGEEELAVICDISSAGIGMRLPQRYALNSVLLVEPLSCRAKTVLARVTRVVEQADGWLHGCIMATHLSDEDLACWTTSAQAAPSEAANQSMAAIAHGASERQTEEAASVFCEEAKHPHHCSPAKV